MTGMTQWMIWCLNFGQAGSFFFMHGRYLLQGILHWILNSRARNSAFELLYDLNKMH